jgi:hypothetical protein
MGPEKLEKVLEKLATSEKPQSLSARKARAPPFGWRSERNAARISEENSAGCSQAAK